MTGGTAAAGSIVVLGSGPTADAWRDALPAPDAAPGEGTALAVEASPDLPLEARVAAVHRLLAELPAGVPLLVATRLHTLDVLLAGARPGRLVVGIHLLTPVLAEVVLPARIEEDAVDRLLDRIEAAGIATLPCGDAPGRITDRLLAAASLEARFLGAAGGATPGTLSAALRQGGAVRRLLGDAELDPIAGALHAGLGWPARFHPAGDPLPAVERRPQDPASMALRLDLAVIAEGYRLVAEAVAGTAEIERAMTEGAGWSVGPFTMAGRYGLRAVVTDLAALARDPGADPATRDRFAMPALLWQMATA